MKGNKTKGKKERDPVAQERSPKLPATAPNIGPDKNSRSSHGLTFRRFSPAPLQRFDILPPLFFILLFLYVWLRIEPAVQFYAFGPVFYLSRSFLSRFLMHPGGCLEYAAALLAQLDYSNWLGALVFTFLAGLLFLGTRRWLQRFSRSTSDWGPFVPAFLLLLLREVAEASFLVSGLGLLVALGAALLHAECGPGTRDSKPIRENIKAANSGEREGNPGSGEQLTPAILSRSDPERGEEPGGLGEAALPSARRNLKAAATGLHLGLCSLLSILIFYVAGLWPCLLYAALSGLSSCKRRQRWFLTAGCFLSGGLGPLWLCCYPGGNAAKLWLPARHGLPIMLTCALFLILPLVSVAWWILSDKGETALPRLAAIPAKAPRHFGLKSALAAGLFLLGGIAVWHGLDTQRKAMVQIEYYTSQKDYERVLATAASIKHLKPAAEIHLHLALHHTGRLCQDLFSFTNQATWNLLPSLAAGLESCRAQSQTLLELGQVSEAEHLAHESLEWEGERPDTLRMLAQINILKDRPQAARVFLNVLHQVPTQRQWAGNYLRQLAANPRLPDDKELAQIRSRMVKTDLPHINLPLETFMRQLLHSNPRNQMAFDYLMAHYLLSLEMGKVVEQLKDLEGFGYTSLPRHVEEAILLHQQIKQVQVDLCGHPIRPETLHRFQQWSEAIRQGKFMSPEGRAELAQNFGDTYWYYFLARQGASTPANS